MDLVKEANDELTIRHQAISDIPDKVVVAQKEKSPIEMRYEADQHQRMFAKFVDDKDMDQHVDSNTMNILGINGADDTTALQLNKLPYVDDVGRRAYSDPHEQYEWYPGDRRVYTAIEDRFDFAQKSAPGQALVQASLPDVGTRDYGAAHELHAWYPGDRKYYPYEDATNHAQVSAPALGQLPDVGTRDYSSPHSSHGWYPGDRKHYDFESKFDHAQKNAKQYAQRY